MAISKDIENRVSRYLWGHLRAWKDDYDLAGDGWVGEAKWYSHTLIGQSGGAYSVLETALAQCQSACKDGRRTFACLIPKGTRSFEKSLVLLDDGTLLTLEQFKALLGGA